MHHCSMRRRRGEIGSVGIHGALKCLLYRAAVAYIERAQIARVLFASGVGKKNYRGGVFMAG